AVALATALSGCDGHVSINGKEGKKLSELDLSGKAPTELVLAGPDEVRVTQGDTLAISVEGDAEVKEHLRFTLDGDTLGVMREHKWRDGEGKSVVVLVTMPALREITMAGSGKISAPVLSGGSKVTIAGSGTVETAQVSGDSLDLTVAGSGNYRAAGAVRSLDMTVAGSGSAMLEGLKADTAKVTIAGSGDASFASDGEVKADIMGSGTVTVRGRARCKVSSMGSGRLVCESVDAAPAAPEAPPAPEAPEPPKAP
ncbi:MAG: head GIN domain-containing protein, partial [Novosphingobium sp.]